MKLPLFLYVLLRENIFLYTLLIKFLNIMNSTKKLYFRLSYLKYRAPYYLVKPIIPYLQVKLHMT